MNLDVALKTLNEAMGSFTYPITIPSGKITKNFKLMTTGDFLSIGKQSRMNSGFEYEITLLALIKKLCSDEIDIYKLTDFDRMKILLSIFYNNNNDISTVTFECKDEDCRKDIKYNLDIPKMIEKIDNPKEIQKDYKIGDLSLSMIYGAPIYINTLTFYKELEEELQKVKENKEESEKVEDEFKKKLPLLYIKKIIMNGNEIDFISARQEKKERFLSMVPTNVYDDIDEILSENSFDVETKITDKITCDCGEEMEVEIDLEDFFR